MAFALLHAGGGGMIDTAAEPILPSLVAVMVTTPAATPVTRPFVLTVALVTSEDAHSTARPTSVLPVASTVCTPSCVVPPAGTAATTGVTRTVATGPVGAVTVNAACA